MPATAWRYLVPYQPDFQAALDALRQTVFQRGAYLQPWTDRDAAPTAAPADIEAALSMCGEAGTHSVLDVLRVSLVPGPGLCAIVADALRQEVYGTPHPERDDVDDRRFALVHRMDEGQAAVMIVYKNGTPSQLYFEGLTGS